MLERASRGRVIVGYDGRWQGPSVLEIGAKAAEVAECPLSIVTLYRPVDDLACLEERPLDGWNPLPSIGRSLQRAERRLRERHPDLRISTHALCFDDVRADVEPLRSGILLVLGERHARATEVPALRSASAVLREATACNVVVVRETLAVPETEVIRIPESHDSASAQPAGVR